jgi:hypothetical protein
MGWWGVEQHYDLHGMRDAALETETTPDDTERLVLLDHAKAHHPVFECSWGNRYTRALDSALGWLQFIVRNPK